MKDDDNPRTTVHRRPHTIYLSDSVWDDLERQHLELRLTSSAPSSKIEFIEQVLHAGLRALATAPPRTPRATEAVTSPPAPGQEGIAATTPPSPPPPRDASVPEFAPRREAPSPPTTASPEHQGSPRSKPSRRSGALERLRRASDPGRPAPIQSAAAVPADVPSHHADDIDGGPRGRQ